MTEQLDPSAVEQILARAGISSAAISSSPLLLIASDRPSIVWANGSAVSLLGAAHEREASRRLFRPGPSSQALVNRLRRMASGPEPRLDRLMISRGFQVIPQTVACRAVEGMVSEPLILVQFLDAPSAHDGTAPRFESALTADPGAEASTHRDPPHTGPASLSDVARIFESRFSGRRRLRVLWETDPNGLVTRVGRDFNLAVGMSALTIGDDVVARLHALDAAVGEAVESVLKERRTVTGLRVDWPVEGSLATVLISIGCVFRAGGEPGLRGFCQIHTDQLTERLLPEPKREELQAASPASDRDGPVESRQAPIGESESPSITAPTEPLEIPATPSAAVEPEQPLIIEQAAAASEGEPPSAAATSVGNVVHFPTVKATFVLAALGVDVKPAEPPRTATPDQQDASSDLPPPLWSESPGSNPPAQSDAPGQLTTDEQDAFDHIRKVLGTRAFAESKDDRDETETVLPISSEAPLSQSPPAGEQSFESISPLLDAMPIGIMLHRSKDLVHGNKALMDALGFATVDDLRANLDLSQSFGDNAQVLGIEGETRPFVLTSNEGKALNGEARTASIGGLPATLISFLPERDPSQEGAIEALHRELLKQQASIAEKDAALALSADGIGFINGLGVIAATTSGAEQLFGYRVGELVGKSGAALLMVDQEPAWRSLLVSAAEGTSTRPARGELLGRTRDGGLIPVQVRIGQVAPDRFCVIWADDSSRKRAENGLEAARREAERANTLKSEFLAKVSHEIRTPLNAILGFAEVIMDERLGPVGNTRYVEYLKDIHASGTHVMSLVNDLLDLSRIEAGRLDLKLDAVDANAVVGACVNTLQTQAHRERVIVRLSLAPRLPPALADERSLRQIVLNLLSNAIKFNEPGGQVIISTAVTDSETIAIRIRDTGLGMSDDDIETAMEPFRQLPSGKTAGGSGLGLPLTKALVEASCASMTIKSRPGEGTLVEVLFPIVEHETMSVPAQ